jgi:hypothetical protein
MITRLPNTQDDLVQAGYSIAMPKKLVITTEGNAIVPNSVSVLVASAVRLVTLER